MPATALQKPARTIPYTAKSENKDDAEMLADRYLKADLTQGHRPEIAAETPSYQAKARTLNPVTYPTMPDADIVSAAVWCDSQRENLGAKFLDRVDDALKVIECNPEGPQQTMPNLRDTYLNVQAIQLSVHHRK